MAEAGNSYRILVSASNGRILRSRLIVASDDTEAIRRAAAYHQKRLDFEIWKGRTLSSDWEHGAVRQRLVKSRLERRGFSYNPTSQAGAARKDRRKLLVVSLKEGGRVKDLVALLAIGFGVASALSGFYVAFWMRVRNNQDEFIQDLGAQSKVAGWAAAAAGMSALLQGIDRFY